MTGSPLTPEQIQMRRQAFADQAIAALDDPDRERHWWWLSFTAAAPPEANGQFLGVAIVDAPDEVAAPVIRAHQLGCNPGGQVVMAGPIPDEHLPDERYRRRLLTDRDEIAAAGGVQDTDTDQED